MKINWKKHDGTTLVELMIAIAIGSMILLATSSVLLLGLRIHHKTTETVTQQYTARTVITMLENLASEGDVGKVGVTENGWKLYNRKYAVILSYSKENDIGTIYTGDEDNAILENVSEASLTLEDNLLTIQLKHNDNVYHSSVFCRTVSDNAEVKDETNTDDTDRYAAQKENFVNMLLSQKGTLGGAINHKTHSCNFYVCGKYNFFSEWYIGGYDGQEEIVESERWGPGTAWCGCFVSWGLSMATNLEPPEGHERWFAHVEDFLTYFGSLKDSPSVGDIVFIDANDKDGKRKATHVGVVTKLEPSETGGELVRIKTIEGNVIDGAISKVAEGEYPINDPHILGYGDPWAAAPQGG